MIISKLDFLAHFPMFGGVDDATLISAITQAESEYDTGLPNWLPITLNLIAHILTARTLGVAQSVEAMGVANGTTKLQLAGVGQGQPSWKGRSLDTTPYGLEVSRLLTGSVVGCMYL